MEITMTNDKLNAKASALEGAEEFDVRDSLLMEAVKGAYESMDPTPEQEKRMLAALLEAQAQVRADAVDGGEDGSQAQGGSQSQDGPQAQSGSQPQVGAPASRKRPFKVWKIAVPLAACLALGAVVIGVANAPSPSKYAADSNAAVEVSANAATEGVAEKALSEVYEEDCYEYDGDAGAAMDSLADEAAGSATGSSEETALHAMSAKTESMATADSLSAGEVEEESKAIEEPEPREIVKPNTEEHKTIDEVGFVSTRSEPLSTVSADVDTASYCNLRRMINSGYMIDEIPSGAVRLEEMLNYFDYDYPTVTCGTGGDLFSMQAQSAQCPWNEDTQLLVLGFEAGTNTQVASKGSNLVFLIDVSGSMDEPDKLDLLQDSFATLLESLGANDRVSIVTYAGDEEIVLEGASGDDEMAILKAIYKLKADGSTNGEAGLKMAYEVAQRNFIEGGVNRIVMASDGDLNVGITSESALHDFVEKKRESGIYLSVLGFGSGNYKDNKMEVLADYGNGSYHYIDCIEEVERVLQKNLTSNVVPFADNVKVQVEFNPAQVKAYRLIGYENRKLASSAFRDDAVDAGDVGPGAQFTVAYEVVLADSKMEVDEPDLKYSKSETTYANGSSDWLTATMRYHVFEGDEMHEQELPVGPAVVTAAPNSNWNLAAAVIEFGMLARGSHYAGTSSEDGILELLSKVEGNEQVADFRKLVITAME